MWCHHSNGFFFFGLVVKGLGALAILTVDPQVFDQNGRFTSLGRIYRSACLQWLRLCFAAKFIRQCGLGPSKSAKVIWLFTYSALPFCLGAKWLFNIKRVPPGPSLKEWSKLARLVGGCCTAFMSLLCA